MSAALGLLVALGAAPACPPLSEPFARELDTSIHQALDVGRQLSPALRVTRAVTSVAPAPVPAPEPGLLRVHLVPDAPCAGTSAPGLCVADTRDPGSPEIVCNATALLGLVGRESEGETAPSPGLFFVLAHELGHVAGSSAGRFAEDGVVIWGDSPLEVKREDVDAVCQAADEHQSAERSADAWARSALDRALDSPRFGAGVLGGAGARFHAAGMLEGIAERTFLPPDVRGLWSWEEFRLATPKVVDAAVLRARCRVMRTSSQRFLVPDFGSGHPPMPVRLLKVARALRDGAQRAGPPDATSPIAGSNLADLLEVATVADLEAQEEGVAFFKAFATKFCTAMKKPPPSDKACAKAERPLAK